MSGNPRNAICSFCGRTQDEVERLFVGQDVCICNECVELCYGLMDNKETSKNTKPKALKKTISDFPRPNDIKTVLDQYVIGQDEAKIALCVASLQAYYN